MSFALIKSGSDRVMISLCERRPFIKYYFNLRRFKKRLDPRHYNGAIFIGLDSPVVKSHGGTDYIGFSNSLDVCCRIIKGNLIEKIKDNIK